MFSVLNFFSKFVKFYGSFQGIELHFSIVDCFLVASSTCVRHE